MKESRVMTNRSLGAIVLSLVLVAGCSGATTTGPVASAGTSAVPAAASAAPAASGIATLETKMEGPTVIDVASDVVSTSVVTPSGASIAADGVTLAVPPGGVTRDTTVVVTRLNEPFHMNVFAPSAPTDVTAIPIGHPYDFGPSGVQFAQPVDVTLPYDPQYVPGGTDAGRLGAAYFTGIRWVVVGGRVDTTAHTVTVRLKAFNGIAWIPVLAVGLALGALANAGVHWYYGGEGTKSDPISQKQAATWIVPNDPAVSAAAAKASVGGVPLGDPKKLGDYLAQNGDKNSPVTLVDAAGTPTTLGGRYSKGAGTNWQKPGDFLTTGKMSGDCTDVTNALVSVFRAKGYPAKGVFGYAGDKEHPHAWGEVLIGGKMYLIDEDGNLQKLDTAMAAMNLLRPDADDPRAFMWDENGETPYETAWWTKVFDLNGTWRGTLTFTEVNVDPEVAKQAEDQGCTLAMLDALKGKALPMTMTIKLGAMGKGSATILIDMSSFKDAKGKALQSSPQTLPFTSTGNKLVFQLEQSSGSTSAMSAVVVDNGGGVVMQGTMTVSGQGYSAKAVWTVGPA
jgi:hypothetical protein